MKQKNPTNISLPSLLFLNFKNMDLKLEYINNLSIFCFFALLFLLGQAINRIASYNPILLSTYFAFGTLGFPISFNFGMKTYLTTILSIGHEFLFGLC